MLCPVYIFAFMSRYLGVWEVEFVLLVVACGISYYGEVGAGDVDCGVKGFDGFHREFSESGCGPESGRKAGEYCCVKRVFVVECWFDADYVVDEEWGALGALGVGGGYFDGCFEDGVNGRFVGVDG